MALIPGRPNVAPPRIPLRLPPPPRPQAPPPPPPEKARFFSGCLSYISSMTGRTPNLSQRDMCGKLADTLFRLTRRVPNPSAAINALRTMARRGMLSYNMARLGEKLLVQPPTPPSPAKPPAPQPPRPQVAPPPAAGPRPQPKPQMPPPPPIQPVAPKPVTNVKVGSINDLLRKSGLELVRRYESGGDLGV